MDDNETRQETVRILDDKAFLATMSNSDGRRSVYNMLDDSGVYRQSYVPGDRDATIFNEGRRSIGLGVLERIRTICPEAYLVMMNEIGGNYGD